MELSLNGSSQFTSCTDQASCRDGWFTRVQKRRRITAFALLTVLCLLWLPANGHTQTDDRVASVSARAVESLAAIQTFCGQRPCGTGSGFVIDPSGTIVTNYHVIAAADRITVTVGGTAHRNARVVAVNKSWDLALLQVDATGLAALPLAASADVVRLGETVVAAGNPQGLRGTISTGIVSSRRSGAELRMPALYIAAVQSTAAISEGSSGGPLLNLQGEVVGIHAFMFVEGQNLNFAIPVDMLHIMLANEQTSFQLQSGELGVLLEWDGPYDLDLEIWSQERSFMGNASWLGRSPDAHRGGREWFVFRDYGHQDFSSGRYVISAYFSGPETDDSVTAKVTIMFPGGKEHSYQQGVSYWPPYDQWWVVEIDVDAETAIGLEPFGDHAGSARYDHSPGELAVVLSWEGDFDLDLEIWSEDFEFINNAPFIGESPDISNGDEGEEWFVFRRYSVGDYSSGRYVISPYLFGPETDAAVTAVVTVHFPDGRTQSVSRPLEYQPPYDQWFAVLVDVDRGAVEILDFFWE
jgi:S1-C subfamily serine protease